MYAQTDIALEDNTFTPAQFQAEIIKCWSAKQIFPSALCYCISLGLSTKKLSKSTGFFNTCSMHLWNNALNHFNDMILGVIYLGIVGFWILYYG